MMAALTNIYIVFNIGWILFCDKKSPLNQIVFDSCPICCHLIMTLTQICQNVVGITWFPSKKHLNGEHRRSLQKLIPDECLNG